MSDTKATTATKQREQAIRKLARGAKVGPRTQARPWQKFDPEAALDTAMTLRLNDYDRCVLAHLAGAKQTSVQRVLSELIRDYAAGEIERVESEGT